MEKTVTLEFGDDGFATIRMINGENRFRSQTIKEWNKTLDSVLERDGVKSLIITGSGKFFSNGIDLNWLSQQKRPAANEYFFLLHGLVKRILVFPIPTVALINGHAFGAGAFIALACDFRVMRPDKGWLCWPETTLGLQFGDQLLQVARSKIPPGVVQREALLFARRMTGNVAKSLGLADDVVEESKMAESGKALVKAALGPKGLERGIFQQMKKDIYSHHVDLSKL